MFLFKHIVLTAQESWISVRAKLPMNHIQRDLYISKIEKRWFLRILFFGWFWWRVGKTLILLLEGSPSWSHVAGSAAAASPRRPPLLPVKKTREMAAHAAAASPPHLICILPSRVSPWAEKRSAITSEYLQRSTGRTGRSSHSSCSGGSSSSGGSRRCTDFSSGRWRRKRKKKIP